MASDDPVDLLVAAIMSDQVQFERMQEWCDTYPARVSGSQALEDSIDWCMDTMQLDALDAVYTEKAVIPNWHHGEGDNLRLLEPGYPRRMLVTSLGNSIPTSASGIQAPVLVVSTFDELNARASEAEGKIIVYDAPFTSYSATVPYRSSGAVEAAKVGGIASLTRAITPFSLYTLHTGVMHYDKNVTKIPAGSITMEDAMMLHRIQNRSQTPVINLTLDCEPKGYSVSRNLIAEVTGSEYPEQVVIVSGHTDSWDNGATGAQDDAVGAFGAWQVVRMMAKLGLRAKRTVRAILWTCEEFGGYGGESYAIEHKTEMGNISLAIEMDNNGAYVPLYFSVDASAEALDMLEPVLAKLQEIANITFVSGGGGEDIDPMIEYGVPVMGLSTQPDVDVNGYSNYFDIHHSSADTVDKLNQDQWNQCVASLAIMSYMVADMDTLLPRDTTITAHAMY